MGFVRLELPCRSSSPVVASPDPEPRWTFDGLISELRFLEDQLGSPSPLKTPAKDPGVVHSDSCHEKVMKDVRSGPFVMSVLDYDEEYNDEGSSELLGEEEKINERDFSSGARFSGDYSDSEGSDADLQIVANKSYLMNKKGIEEEMLHEIEFEEQLRIKEEVSSRLAVLKESQREADRSALTISQVGKYVEGRLEMDRRLDKQYQRKIAEVTDSHLSAIQRDHEQRSQIEERKIRDYAALEEAKRKILIEEQIRQERAREEKEARLKAVKLAEEAQRAAQEAARKAASEERATKEAAERAAKEAAEKESSRITKPPEPLESSARNDKENKDPSLVNSTLKNKQLAGIKALATDSALQQEASRLKVYNEVAEKTELIGHKDFERYGRQIVKHIKQIIGTTENVRTKANALVKMINDPVCPPQFSLLLIAKKVVSLCEDPTASFDNIAFACGHVILLVTSQVPAMMDFVLAEFHKACIYTVPKHLLPSDQVSHSKDYWKMVGYREEDGVVEGSEKYLTRIHSYMKLYAAILQTEIDGINNPYGLKEGWAWLARFLNALPATRSTAYALEAFLKMAGYALYRKYRSQFRKIIDIVSSSFLPVLKERGDKKMVEIITRLEQYLVDKVYTKEPEGWRLQASLLSTYYV